MNEKTITLGSLFDGIGAVPFAASYFGITPVWASEILPNAISITRRHFPEMTHLGDITQLDGATLPPVHIIAFGSPCQSWSVAGTRTGFEGKSGLFMEAIRIIREMRCATNGKYPQIVLFENVPGLLHCKSDGRSDYKTVLEAFTESEIPMPKSGRWANAGMVRGRGIDFAWVIRDAQYHRTAQRRRRLFAVLDFGGRRAGEILFVEKSLSRYFEARASERQGTATASESRAGGEMCGNAGFNGYRSITGSVEYGEEHAPCISATMPPNVVAAFMAGQAKNARSIAYNEAVSPTLKASPSGLNQVPCICEPQIARTLTARGDSSPCADRGQNIVVINKEAQTELSDADKNSSNSLTPWDTTQMRVLTPDGAAPTLLGADGGGGRNPAGVVLCVGSTQANAVMLCEQSPTITAAAGTTGDNKPFIVHPDICATLCGSGAGLSRPAGMASETDLCVAYCLQGNMIGRQEKNGPQGSGINEEVSFTISAADRHAVAAVDCRNLKELDNYSGTLQSKASAGYSLNYQNPVRIRYILRRLTPTECERLMSLPDEYTKYGNDGKLMSDSTRYQLCGNSIVVNVLAPIVMNIAAYLMKGSV